MDLAEQSLDKVLNGTEGPLDLSAVLLTALSPGWLGSGLQAIGKSDLQQLSPAAFAYLGDAVYELFIRTAVLLPPKKLQLYHQQVVAEVRAETQASHLVCLQPYLTEAEQEIVRRGRNAAAKGPKRVNPEVYRQATGLEALFGYLYLSDPARLVQLLGQLRLQNAAETASLPADGPLIPAENRTGLSG